MELSKSTSPKRNRNRNVSEKISKKSKKVKYYHLLHKWISNFNFNLFLSQRIPRETDLVRKKTPTNIEVASIINPMKAWRLKRF